MFMLLYIIQVWKLLMRHAHYSLNLTSYQNDDVEEDKNKIHFI